MANELATEQKRRAAGSFPFMLTLPRAAGEAHSQRVAAKLVRRQDTGTYPFAADVPAGVPDTEAEQY